MSTSYPPLPLDWEVLLPAGPALANHVGCIIDNNFYIHGGITKHGSKTPSNILYKLNLDSLIWNEVRVSGSPALSHHTCVVLQNRYMVLIGGWNGHQRTSRVFVFDTCDQQWLFPKDSGFPDGAGLSSHAVSLLTTGEILIVGREGCLKFNKKNGNVFLLRGSIEKGEYIYEKLTNDTSSRSGHTLTIVDNNVYIVGGRVDQLVEHHVGFSSTEPLGTLNTNFSCVSKYLQPLCRTPNGRKNHITIVGKDCFLVHGGETFDGKSRQAVGELFLMKTKPSLTCYKIGNSHVTRASHVCVSTGDRVLFHGGKAWKNVIYGDCYELKLKL